MYLLLVEDNPTDTDGDPDPASARVSRARRSSPPTIRSRLKEHLKRGGYDVVVTDYWLGWSDGLSILQRVRDRSPRSRG